MGDEKKSISTKVCVTGGAGYIGSWLVNKLLLRGYTVHATLRNLSDAHKVGLLGTLPHAEERLKLFEADMYQPAAFQPAIDGCEYVFHVAKPMQHRQSQFKDITEAAIAGVQSILRSCRESGTVTKFIYTGSVMSASPLREDGTSFNDSMDESCWTPLNHPFAHDGFTSNYTISKTLVEKEMLKYNDKEKYGFDVISLVCSLVVGDTLLPQLSGSQETIVSPLSGNSSYHNYLKLLQEVTGSIPLTHIDDVCEAHIFCIENPLMNGRFVCAQAYPSITEITAFYQETYPEFRTVQIAEEQGKVIRGSSTKLMDMGFKYKYDMQKMLSDTVDCARRLGALQ